MPTSPLKFLFAVHNHQPVGNFDHVFEEVFEKSYRPYFEVLKPFTDLKTTAHFTGPLLEWLEGNRPDFLKMLKDLVQSGRLELLSGGFYEPLLATLPEEDAIGQIRMMNEYLLNRFGFKPRGLWLAERIWSLQLPKWISEAGLEFTVLDDTHFYYAGLGEEAMHGYYLTEHQGHTLKLFPILKSLRYSIPFELPEVTIDRLRAARQRFGCKTLTYADDGEKFGSWPETWQWVYGDGYLEKLFRTLQENREWLSTAHFSEILDQQSANGRVYLPPASYEEMMEWALPARTTTDLHSLKQEMRDKGFDEARTSRFIRGGQWDNFLIKYEESNRMHKKMQHVSAKVRQMKQGPEQTAARKALYRSQCNCAYWHGMFGGLYLNYLRHEIYRNLIEAENLADRSRQKGGKNKAGWTLEWKDFDLDGQKEFLASNSEMGVILAPDRGGALLELDYRPACFNLSNVLGRREEAYHQTIREQAGKQSDSGGAPQTIHDRVHFKQEGLDQALVYDRRPRLSFLDHWLPENISLENLRQEQWDAGSFGTVNPFNLQKENPGAGNADYELTFTREALAGPEAQPVHLAKTYCLSKKEARIEVNYQWAHQGDRPLQGWFAVEFNFTLLAGDAPDRTYVYDGLRDSRLVSSGDIDAAKSFGMCDAWSRFSLQWSLQPEARWIRFPVETVSQSEDGFEKTYQGSSLWVLWKTCLEPGQTGEGRVRLEVTPLSQEG